MPLKIGDSAPTFSLPTDEGQTVSLSDFKGRPVILYFYPKDSTPGCTREACDFRDHLDEFKKHNAVVLGVSKDSQRSHAKFKEKHQLTFPLLVDADGEVCTAYHVFKEKSMFGKSFLGIVRSTFLIDKTGKIKASWTNVKVPGHVKTILDYLSKQE